MLLRKYQTDDCGQVTELFYQTVHCVNAKDYTKEQLDAWATGKTDSAEWNNSLLKHDAVVAIENDKIVGFGDIDQSGYLDRLYVHKDYQRQGIASAICNELERIADVKCITTHASITAKSFFVNRGYRLIREQEVIRQGIPLKNYVMEKQMDPGH